MTTNVSPEAGNLGAKDDLLDGRSPSDSTVLPQIVVGFDPEHEARLRAWGEGFDAAVAWLMPQLDRANSDADRWYLRACNSPDEIAEITQRRMDEHFAEECERFMAGGAP